MSGERDRNNDPSSPLAEQSDVGRAATPGSTTLVSGSEPAPRPSAVGRGTLVQRAYGEADTSYLRSEFFARATRVQREYGAPVQRVDGDAGVDAGAVDPAAIAEAGMRGPAGTLPHLDRIQHSFGAHDVSGVRAHVGGRAAEASGALGARAYAANGAVAFASSPDLHTAAHEAAHVVQQRGGVQLRGGIDGGANDDYERHADAVADKVVRGECAKALLSEKAGGGATARAVVQRKLLETTASVPEGETLFATQISVGLLPAEQQAQLGPRMTIAASVIVSGSNLVLAVQAQGSVWTASLSGEQVLQALASIGEALKQLQPGGHSVSELLQKLRARVNGSHVHVSLWGEGTDESFIVFDVNNLVQSIINGDAAGLRPVEAQILAGKTGLRVVGGGEVKAATAMPGAPVGDWFELPVDERLAAVVGVEPTHQVWAGVFYDQGVLRVGLKASAKATTGIVAQVDLAAILHKLEHYGAQVAASVKKLVENLGRRAQGLFKVISGVMRLDLPDLPGTWFAFDLNLQLPHLLAGGSFDLASLLPTSFQIKLRTSRSAQCRRRASRGSARSSSEAFRSACNA